MKKIYLIVLVAALLSGCQGNQNRISANEEQKSEDVAQTETSNSDIPQTETSNSDIPQSSWQYSKDVDDLTGNVTSLNATLYSDNKIVYDSYGNSTNAAIYLSYNGKRNQALIILGGKEFEAKISEFQGSGFMAVFDDGEVDDTWSYVFMSESRKALTLVSPGNLNDYTLSEMFINKLKQSNTCKIQLNLEEVGRKTFIFKTKGLKWDF